MPAPRTPTNVATLRGAFKKDPQRLRARQNEPKDKRPIGNCPTGLSKLEKRAWRELIDNSIPGVLFKSDRIGVEFASRLIARMRNPDVSFSPADQSNLRALLGQLGMLPADRSKIIVAKSENKNPFSED